MTPADTEGTKAHTKSTAKEKCRLTFIQEMESSGNNKSKVKYLLERKTEKWTPGKPAQYMMELTRKQVSNIFKAKTRMLDVKNNFRNKHPNNTCRACAKSNETQEHVLSECQSIHQDDSSKVEETELTSDDTEALKRVSQKIELIMAKLEQQK